MGKPATLVASAKAAREHPLIAALFDSLPPIGQAFTPEQRSDWLRMMAMTFNLAYGAVDELPDFLGAGAPARANAPTPRAGLAKPVSGSEPAEYIIDVNGNARREPGAIPIKATDIPRAETLWDERPDGHRDLDSIVWADGTWPADALPSLNIVTR